MQKYLSLFLKGMAMGAADVVPGVSGGTIAFITNIYEELIGNLSRFDAHAIKLLFKGQFRDLWIHIGGTFLAVLFAHFLHRRTRRRAALHFSRITLVFLLQNLVQPSPRPGGGVSDSVVPFVSPRRLRY